MVGKLSNRGVAGVDRRGTPVQNVPERDAGSCQDQEKDRHDAHGRAPVTESLAQENGTRGGKCDGRIRRLRRLRYGKLRLRVQRYSALGLNLALKPPEVNAQFGGGL